MRQGGTCVALAHAHASDTSTSNDAAATPPTATQLPKRAGTIRKRQRVTRLHRSSLARSFFFFLGGGGGNKGSALVAGGAPFVEHPLWTSTASTRASCDHARPKHPAPHPAPTYAPPAAGRGGRLRASAVLGGAAFFSAGLARGGDGGTPLSATGAGYCGSASHRRASVAFANAYLAARAANAGGAPWPPWTTTRSTR